MKAVVVWFFFFFQAEDGIRDGRVTGVQTCALPISRDRQPARPRRRGRRRRGRGGGVAPRQDRVASAATELTKEARVADQLTLGMLGGTGPQGKGLALRLATAGHQILL